MTWRDKWIIDFTSRLMYPYRIHIQERDYDGAATRLTGASVPFETQEDDDEDIFTVVRGQTGYIRIVSDDVTLIDKIVPPNNLYYLVKVTYRGNEKDILWQGFLQTEVFEQEWRGGQREIELPVKSLLASLESTELGSRRKSGKHMIASLLYDIFSTFDVDIQFVLAWDSWIHLHLLYLTYPDMYFTNEVRDGEKKDNKAYSKSGDEVVENICGLLGLVLREQGNKIFFTIPGTYEMRPFLSLGDLKNPPSVFDDPYGWKGIYKDYALSDVIEEWRGAENTESRIKPRKSVSITISIEQLSTEELLTLPDIEEEDRTAYKYWVKGGTLTVQPYILSPDEEDGVINPVTNGGEYSYGLYERAGRDEEGYAGNRRAPQKTADISEEEVSKEAPWRGHYFSNETTSVRAGCYPCRWAFKPSEQGYDTIATTEGYCFQLVGICDLHDYAPLSYIPVFHFETEGTRVFSGGYICINFNLLTLLEGRYDVWYSGAPSSIKVFCNWYERRELKTTNIRVQLWMKLKVGPWYWTGTEWSSTESRFRHTIKNCSVEGNWVNTMDIPNTAGLLIPLGTTVSDGKVTFEIMEYARIYLDDESDDSSHIWMGYSHFMSNFQLSYVPSNDPTSLLSDRSENNYYAKTDTEHVAGTKHLDFTVGTNNYNRPSHTFLMYSDKQYTETSVYYSNIHLEDGKVVYDDYASIRIEHHLLARLKDYYSQPRRIYNAEVYLKKLYRYVDEEHQEEEVCLPVIYPSYNGHTFMMVLSNYDWREETQKVKLIEIS